MSPDKRNFQVIASLIAAMTLGAAALLWMEPVRERRQAPPLMATVSDAVTELEIAFVSANSGLEGFDAIVFPDGQVNWSPSGSSIRAAVVDAGGGRLEAVQKRGLLELLGGLHQSGGLSLGRISLATESDPRESPDAPAGARSLYEWLVAKHFLR